MSDSTGFWKRPWDLRAPAFEIASGLYYVGNTDVSCHLIVASDGICLIDTAFAETAYLLTESIRRVGVDPADIDLIIHTHGHVDHCGATRRMRELTRATVALAEQDVETVENGTWLTCAEAWYGMDRFETFTVDRPLGHMDQIDLGDTVITCHHTPGHTAGVMTYTFETQLEGERMTAGLFGGAGLWTMLDEHREKNGYPGNREDFARSLEYLKTLDVAVWLGAHPDQNGTFEKHERLKSGETPNPFIDPAGWRRSIDEIEAEFREQCSA